MCRIPPQECSPITETAGNKNEITPLKRSWQRSCLRSSAWPLAKSRRRRESWNQGDEGQGGQAAGQIKPVAEQQQQHPAQAQRADVIQRRADKGDSQQDGKRHDSFLSLSNEKSG